MFSQPQLVGDAHWRDLTRNQLRQVLAPHLRHQRLPPSRPVDQKTRRKLAPLTAGSIRSWHCVMRPPGARGLRYHTVPDRLKSIQHLYASCLVLRKRRSPNFNFAAAASSRICMRAIPRTVRHGSYCEQRSAGRLDRLLHTCAARNLCYCLVDPAALPPAAHDSRFLSRPHLLRPLAPLNSGDTGTDRFSI